MAYTENLDCISPTLFLVAANGPAQEKGHVAGVFGWTFGENTNGLYGAQVGVRLTDTIQIVGGVERMDDVLTGRYALLLRDFSTIGNLDIIGSVPATCGGVGARSIRRFRQEGGFSPQPIDLRGEFSLLELLFQDFFHPLGEIS